MLAQDPAENGIAAVLVAAPLDVGCHLHDLRHALDRPGDRDAPTTAISFAVGRGWLGMRLDAAGLPAMNLRCAEREWVLGRRPAGITVEADRFELFRVIMGRRSEEQVLALNWDVDPATYLDALSPYPQPEHAIIE